MTDTKELAGEWFTFPAESNDSDANIIVSTRQDVDKFRTNPRFKYRITMGLPYSGDAKGMPDEATSELIGQITDNFEDVLKKDPVAVLTEVSTGDNRREWVFYTLSLPIFNKKVNEALAPLPYLTIDFTAEEDPQWEMHS